MENKEYPTFINNEYHNYTGSKIPTNVSNMLAYYFLNTFNITHLNYFKTHSQCLPTQFLNNFLLSMHYSDFSNVVVIPLGHASCLILYQRLRILLDPILDKSSFFFHRYTEPVTLFSITPIDVIIFSHDHPDHFNKKDLRSILTLSPHAKIYAPSGFDKIFAEFGLLKDNLKTATWWETLPINGKSISITCLPAIHWSQSTLENRNKSLWASWMITLDDTSIYFTGDTAYGKHFKTIASYFRPIDIALIPIAPYHPRKIQKASHINTEESFQAFLDLGKPIFIPIHWGVFAYGEEPLKEPIQKIINLFIKNNCISKLQATIINTPYIYTKKTNE